MGIILKLTFSLKRIVLSVGISPGNCQCSVKSAYDGDNADFSLLNYNEECDAEFK